MILFDDLHAVVLLCNFKRGRIPSFSFCVEKKYLIDEVLNLK